MQYSLLAFTLVFIGVVVASVNADGNSTTPDQNTTTTKPTTATSAATTVAKSTTPSSVMPTTNQSTTVKPTTTTEPSKTTSESPKTTAAPSHTTPEAKNNYTYYKNKTACLKAIFSAHFQREKKVWNVTKDAVIDNTTSECGLLAVKFGDDKFSIVFSQTDKGSFYISKVDASLGDVQASAENLTLAKTSNGSSYLCASGITVPLSDNITLYMKDVQLQAFSVKDGKFATAVECTGDVPNNLLVPIIVGCSLGGLIVVVLIAYCILRRRAPAYSPVDTM